MPANLPPAYYEAERKLRGARNTPEKVVALQEMITATPKHKGTDHLRAGQRARMARLMEELEKPSYTRSGGPQPFALRKEGVGQAVLIGLPNAGKSQLLAALTGASAKVAAYPFTTQVPLPGILQVMNVLVQMVDTPAINDRDVQTRLFSLLRNADMLVIVVDLSADALGQMDEITEELGKRDYRLLPRDESPEADEQRMQKRALLVGNKGDETGALDRYQALEQRYGERFPVLLVSAVEQVGLDELKEAVFTTLERVRVYTKAPGGEPSFDKPIVLATGSTVDDAARSLHRDWERRLKYALLWGSGKFDGQRVGRDYVLADGDVLEFHG